MIDTKLYKGICQRGAWPIAAFLCFPLYLSTCSLFLPSNSQFDFELVSTLAVLFTVYLST